MAGKTSDVKKKDYIEIAFMNDPAPELWRQFREGVISANLSVQVPAHLQEPLVDEFIKAGLMAP